MTSIRARLVAAYATLLVLVLVGTACAQALRERELIRRFTRDKLLALAGSVMASVSVMLLEENWNQINETEKDLLDRTPDLVYVMVADRARGDEIVAGTPPELLGQRVPDLVDVATTDAANGPHAEAAFVETFLLRHVEYPTGRARGERGDRILELSTPTGGRTRTGTLRMGVSLRELDRAVAASMRQVAAVGGVGLLVAVLAVYLLAGRLSAPIVALTKAAERIAAGALDQRIGIARKDEIGVLAGAFDSMAGALQRSFAKLSGTLVSFERFVPRKFLDVIAPEGVEHIRVGSHATKAMTILFSDIRGYTTMSESTAPIAIFRMLNQYLDAVGTPIGEHGGFIDKYIGDAVMALFDDEATDDALDAALGMRSALEAFNATSSASGRAHLQTGIGVHRGDVVMGAVGFQAKIDSTVIGDAVNVASRVEGLTKSCGVEILVTGEVVAALRDPSRFVLRLVDAQAMVKGKAKPLALYELAGHAGAHATGARPSAAG